LGYSTHPVVVVVQVPVVAIKSRPVVVVKPPEPQSTYSQFINWAFSASLKSLARNFCIS